MAYMIDSNVFITAKDRYYGFDFCPGFWRWVEKKHQTEVVVSVESVGHELTSGNDDLAEWAKRRGPMFFRAPTPADVAGLEKVARWVSQQDCDQQAMDDFLQTADHYLVGQALAAGHTVVTLEDPANSRRKVKIPNVCTGVGVNWIDTFDMLRREHARFVLGAPS